MSMQIPQFNTGDMIRVMSTSDMERAGFANQRGVIFGITQLRGEVQLCHIKLNDGRQVDLHNYSLVKASL